MERLVRRTKEFDQVRLTHILETVEGGTCQDNERTRPTEAHSLSGESRERDLSGHENNLSDRGPLTNWRRQTEGLVRTPKESDQVRPTHSLKTADGGICQDTDGNEQARTTHTLDTADRRTCQDTERNRSTEAHSHPGDGRQRQLSGHRRHLIDQGPLTFWRRQTEGLVRSPKEFD